MKRSAFLLPALLIFAGCANTQHIDGGIIDLDTPVAETAAASRVSLRRAKNKSFSVRANAASAAGGVADSVNFQAPAGRKMTYNTRLVINVPVNDKFFFTQISDDNEGNREFYTSGQYTRYISRVLPDRKTKVVNTSQKDCSIRIALDGDDEMWISYGCIDYLETKRINDDNKQPLLPPKEVVEATEEVNEVKEVKVLNNTNDESKKEADENQDSKLKRLKADNDVLH